MCGALTEGQKHGPWRGPTPGPSDSIPDREAPGTGEAQPVAASGASKPGASSGRALAPAIRSHYPLVHSYFKCRCEQGFPGRDPSSVHLPSSLSQTRGAGSAPPAGGQGWGQVCSPAGLGLGLLLAGLGPLGSAWGQESAPGLARVPVPPRRFPAISQSLRPGPRPAEPAAAPTQPLRA